MKDLDSLKELIKQHVSLGEMLRIDGRITGLIEEEQFACNFHGVDRKKSSRYYRATDTSYCWVCKEKLDAISYVRKKEGMSFGEAINRIVRDYAIDTSGLPEATEAHVKKLQEVVIPKIDNKKIVLEKMRLAITAVRYEVELATYTKFVYVFMVLKYSVPEDQFTEQYTKFKNSMLRVFERLRK